MDRPIFITKPKFCLFLAVRKADSLQSQSLSFDRETAQTHLTEILHPYYVGVGQHYYELRE